MTDIHNLLQPLTDHLPLTHTYNCEIKKIQKAGDQNGHGPERSKIKPQPPPSGSPSDSRRSTARMVRSTSASSLSKSTSQIKYYNKAIDYLKEQYNSTLEKLHQEVSDLKSENKKLNFQILVENEGGSASIVRETLADSLKEKGTKRSLEKSNIANDVLLSETIKELKVKLKITEDSNQHLNSTIRNLNKKMNLLKKFGPVGSSGVGREPPSELRLKSLYLPNPPSMDPSASTSGTSFRNVNSNHSYHNAHKSKSSETRSSKIHNQYQEILDEKERVITDLARQNEAQRSKIEELTDIIKEYEKGLSAGYNSPKFGARRTNRAHREDPVVLKSTASKIRLSQQMGSGLGRRDIGIGQLGPLNTIPSSGSIAVHTSSSGTTTILPPLNVTNQPGILTNLNVNMVEANNQQHAHHGDSLDQSVELPYTETQSKNMPLPKNKTRIEINKINQQRLDEAEGGHNYRSLRKNYELDRGEECE